MSIFRRKQSQDIGEAVADGMAQSKSMVRVRLANESPELLEAIDKIDAATNLEDLDLALQKVCAAYEPLFDQIVEMDRSRRLTYLLGYESVWYDAARKKGNELVLSRTGRALRPGELGNREGEITKRDTPGYSPFENPMPPRTTCRNLMLAIQSFE